MQYRLKRHYLLSVGIAMAVLLVGVAWMWSSADSGSAGLRPGVSEFQAELLADGTVTVVEYNYAVASTMACVEASGAVVATPIVRPDGRLRFEFGGTRDLERMNEFTAAYDDCYEEYLLDIDRSWSAQVHPAVLDNLPVFRAVVECYIDHGFLPPEPELTDARVLELYRLGPTLVPDSRWCVREYQETSQIDE